MFKMYINLKFRCSCSSGVLSRFLSSVEVSTALRPFYFSVHPDLFGKYPEQRKINENSLQQLSALLEAQQSSRRLTIPPLPFYLRQKHVPEGQFKLVKIQLNSGSVRETVMTVLHACKMPTNYVDKIPTTPSQPSQRRYDFKVDFHTAYEKYNSEFEKATHMKRKVEEKRTVENLIEWIFENSEIAKDKYESTSATRGQVKSLIENLCNTYGIKEVKYDDGWNISHIRGSLQSLVALASQHSKAMANLEGRTIALGAFTGVSLDGDVYLNIIDVRNEWLSLIKKVDQQDSALIMIPTYEKTLSSVLRDIHIRRSILGDYLSVPIPLEIEQLFLDFGGASSFANIALDGVSLSVCSNFRKFMPKVSAIQYCTHLRQLITTIGDFYGRGCEFDSTVPESLSKYEIVVEPEAGPLMLSPTGQFIAPSSCPSGELFRFIEGHLDEATQLLTEYSINKHVEKALHKEVKDRFGLLELHKDDSITPGLMILCCERLLTRSEQIRNKLQGNILNVTHYYSVLTEGVLCIPWNFK